MLVRGQFDMAKGDAGDVPAVGAQEQRLGQRVTVAAQDADALARLLEGIADRAVPQQAARDRVGMGLLVHGRAVVHDPRGQQDRPRLHLALARIGHDQVTVAPQSRDLSGQKARPVLNGLLAHVGQQLASGDALRVAWMVAGARDHLQPPLGLVHHGDAAVEPRKIDRRRKTGGPAADDQAIEGAAVVGWDGFVGHLGLGREGFSASATPRRCGSFRRSCSRSRR